MKVTKKIMLIGLVMLVPFGLTTLFYESPIKSSSGVKVADAICCRRKPGGGCCGNGPCNMFCCNCDGGCNKRCERALEEL